MNREEAIKHLEEMVNAYIGMARLTRSISNSPDGVQNKIFYTVDVLDYIKENLK